MIETERLADNSLDRLRSFLESNLPHARGSMLPRRTHLFFLLVLAGEKEGTSIGLPQIADGTALDMAAQFENSDCKQLLDHYEIPYSFHLKERPRHARYDIEEDQPVTTHIGVVYITLDAATLDLVHPHSEDYHVSQGRFHDIPEEEIEAFPSDTVWGRPVNLIDRSRYDRHEAAAIGLAGYQPRATVDAVERAIELGRERERILRQMASEDDLPHVDAAVEAVKHKYRIQFSQQG